MELQETVLVSEGEGEGMAVHRFAPDELVIQDAVEDVVSEYVHCDEDEDVAVETCVMALEGEEEGVAMGDIPEDGLDPEQQEDDQDGCGDYLMISCKFTALQRCGLTRLLKCISSSSSGVLSSDQWFTIRANTQLWVCTVFT